ncbi:MAG TPA: hypothetical protein DCF62_09675 [Porticoccaceae bacterium]|nr:hypothetical protein [Porticoccaceae bacterium]HCO61718.1 hypothetical protein [Porticoccaceae bacterium]
MYQQPSKAMWSLPGLTALAVLSPLVASNALAGQAITDGLKSAMDGATANLNLRYRYEYVDQDGIDDEAGASTLRSRLNVKTGKVGGFHGFVEVDNVSYLGGDTFNNTENGVTTRPVVADPDYTEVNQAYIGYAFNEKNSATVGRQRINHAGQRFLGGVGWRQNEQTFDAARLQLQPIEGLNLDYSYIWEVNRIFGPEGADAEFEGDTHAFLASYKLAEGHTLSAYAYLLDFNEAAALSSETYGIDYKGSFALTEGIKLGVNLAVAEQSDYQDNPADFEAGYYFGEFSAAFKPVTIAIGHEVLESDNGVSFKTPLATLHKFQGFADKFLVTPAGGIEDTYLKVATKIGPVKLIAFYHDFEAETGGMDYGDEIDFIAAYKINANYSVLFKYAAYDADDFATDTDKAWLMVSASF